MLRTLDAGVPAPHTLLLGAEGEKKEDAWRC